MSRNNHPVFQSWGRFVLTQSDGIKLYSKKYFKKGHTLNAARFWERYKTQLNTMLPGRTFYYANWGW